MNSYRYLSPSGLSAWTFRFGASSTGRVYGRLENRSDIHVDDPSKWGMVRRETFSAAAALKKINELEGLGWKLG